MRAVNLWLGHAPRGVDPGPERPAARGGEVVTHVRVADAMLEIDECKRAPRAAVPEDLFVRTRDAALVQHVAQTPPVVGDPRPQDHIDVEAALGYPAQLHVLTAELSWASAL